MFPDSNLAGCFETVQKTFCRLAAVFGDQFSTFVESYACASGQDYYRRKQMKFRHSPSLETAESCASANAESKQTQRRKIAGFREGKPNTRETA